MELQGRDVTTSTNPASGPRRKSGPAPKSLGAAGRRRRPGDCGGEPSQGVRTLVGSAPSWTPSSTGASAMAAGQSQKSRINFGESRDRSGFLPPPKYGSGPPGLLSIVRGKHRMRHPVHALFRVTALAALLAFPARALAEAAPDPDEAVDQITQMNRDAVTAYQAKKYEDARKILKQALDLAATAGPGQAPDQGPHAHPLRHRRDRRLQAARSRHQAVQEGDRDPERHRPHEGAGDAGARPTRSTRRRGRRARRRRPRRWRRPHREPPPPPKPATPPTRGRTRRSGERPGSRAGLGRQAGERHLRHRRRPERSAVREDDPRLPPRGRERVPGPRDEGSRRRPLRRGDSDQRDHRAAPSPITSRPRTPTARRSRRAVRSTTRCRSTSLGVGVSRHERRGRRRRGRRRRARSPLLRRR